MINQSSAEEKAAHSTPERSPLHLVPEQIRLMTSAQELSFLQKAYARQPTPANRRKLAKLLIFEEQLIEAHTLLTGKIDLHVAECLMLVSCCLQLNKPELNNEAADVARRVFELTDDDKYHSAALAFIGKVLIRQNDLVSAQDVLRKALELDPANMDACKRLAFVHMKNCDDRGFADIADILAQKGAKHSRLFAAQTLSLARNGQIDEAQKLWGFDCFAEQSTIATPEGWPSLEKFNADLAQELLTHPGMRFDRIGSASNQTWRVEHPLRKDRPAIAALAALLIDGIVTRSRDLDAQDHPWTRARPDTAFLRMWSVITESDGFEDWHVHQFGWMSGVYYVQIPDSISAGNSDGGCLKFGLPEDLAGKEVADQFGRKLVRPRAGTMLTFPSSTYHRTFPHATREKRICVAYDVRPMH